MKTTIKKINIREVVPYNRNPRDNTKAIEKVKESIKQFGYNQLLCLDKNNVIIAGHTRYKALMQLGYEEIDVIIAEDLTPQQVKKYRIIDNKTSEIAEWTEDLTLELRELDELGTMQLFFNEPINLDLNLTENVSFTQNDIEKKRVELDNKFKTSATDARLDEQEVTCPNCAEDFYVTLNKTITKKG